MSSVETEWTLDQEIEQIRAFQTFVSEGCGSRLSVLLMAAPGELALADDEVLIQRVDTATRSITVTPKRIDELTADDVLFDANVIDHRDTQYIEHTEAMRAAKCLYRYPDGKNHEGIYE